MTPRWAHRVRARLGGYFWLPCPCCGEMMGGHEWGKWSDSVIPTSNPALSHCICNACAKAGMAQLACAWSAES